MIKNTTSFKQIIAEVAVEADPLIPLELVGLNASRDEVSVQHYRISFVFGSFYKW